MLTFLSSSLEPSIQNECIKIEFSSLQMIFKNTAYAEGWFRISCYQSKRFSWSMFSLWYTL